MLATAAAGVIAFTALIMASLRRAQCHAPRPFQISFRSQLRELAASVPFRLPEDLGTTGKSIRALLRQKNIGAVLVERFRFEALQRSAETSCPVAHSL